MDRRQREGDLNTVILATQQSHQSRIWTSLPAIITEIDFAKMTVSAQPTIQGVFTDQKGISKNVTMPLLVDVPIQYPGGGGFTLTFPIAIGDECLITFSARCIDSWWQSGGIQTQAEKRMHDLSDGFANVGVKSQPNVIPSINTSTVQLRSNDGSTYVEVNGSQIVNVVAPGGINLNGVIIDSSGNLTSPATITGMVNVIFGSISGTAHVHGGVQTGSGDTGVPV